METTDRGGEGSNLGVGVSRPDRQVGVAGPLGRPLRRARLVPFPSRESDAPAGSLARGDMPVFRWGRR